MATNPPSKALEEHNMELMQTLDDAWNVQDWDTFDKRHKHDVVVRWPGQPPTHGTHDHRAEAIELFKTFPDTMSRTGRTRCSSPPATGLARSLGSQAR